MWQASCKHRFGTRLLPEESCNAIRRPKHDDASGSTVLQWALVVLRIEVYTKYVNVVGVVAIACE